MIHKREGASWFELVFVVMFIVVVAAIVVPIFARHPQRSSHARCLNNLKQIACAIEMYEDDYDGSVLPWSVGESGVVSPGGFSRWRDLIRPYLVSVTGKQRFGRAAERTPESIFACPGVPEEIANPHWGCNRYDYGYNPYLTQSTTAKQVHYPAVTLRITESALYQYDVHNLPPGVKDAKYGGGSIFCPMPKGRYEKREMNPQAPGWHSGYNDVLWVDGHVSSMTWQRVMYTDRYRGTTDPNVWCRLSPKEGFSPE